MMQFPVTIQKQTYLLSIDHITKEDDLKLIYGITIDQQRYFLSKTLDINDCEQIDSRPRLGDALIDEICDVITSIEIAYKERPSLEFINAEISRILVSKRNTWPT